MDSVFDKLTLHNLIRKHPKDWGNSKLKNSLKLKLEMLRNNVVF